jgi:hypothetical protein
MDRSISQGARRGRNNWGCLVIFGGIFIVAGLAAFVLLTVPTLGRALDSRTWDETPCVILSSQVTTSRGNKGDTYGVAVSYRYEYGGQPYTGDRYRLIAVSSSGRAAKQRVVNQLAPGTTTVCYVDPDRPQESVLDRGIGWEMLLVLLPLVGALVGLIIMGVGLRLRRRAGELVQGQAIAPPRARLFRSPQAAQVRQEPLEFSAGGNRARKLAGLFLFALFWNGMVSLFVYFVFFSDEKTDTCARVFMIPFIAVGLALIVALGYSLLSLSNPRPALRLARGELRAGDTTEVRWTVSGAAHRIQRLRVYLEARESATYRRGTSTTTDHAVVATIPIADVTAASDILSGRASLRVPERAMPSLRASNNAIEWRLVVHGEIPRWPDLKDEFTLTIHPLAPEGVRHAIAPGA